MVDKGGVYINRGNTAREVQKDLITATFILTTLSNEYGHTVQ